MEILSKEEIFEELKKYCYFPNPEASDCIVENVESCEDFLSQYNIEDCVIEPLRESKKLNNWSWFLGATKTCIISKDLPFVIKIPFMGDYLSWLVEDCVDCSDKLEKNLDDDEKGEDKWQYNKIFFCSDGDEFDYFWDYCAIEKQIYDFAEAEGLGEFFAKEECIGEINNYPVYIQEKAEVYGMTAQKFSTKALTTEAATHVSNILKSSSFKGSHPDKLCFGWMADALYYFGEEKFKKFLDFVYKNGINDLHEDNVGYINDRPVLIDYSGFND